MSLFADWNEKFPNENDVTVTEMCPTPVNCDSVFTMLVGLPSSGKTTYCKQQIEARSKNEKSRPIKVFSSDDIRVELFGDVNACSKEQNAQVFDTLHTRIIYNLKSGVDCIYDATNLNRKRRMNFLSMIKGLNIHKECILFVRTPEWIRNKDSLREKKVGEEVIYKMLCNFQLPDYYEGWNDIQYSLLDYDYKNEGVFHIPYEEFNDFDQSNPHHMLTLGKHIEKCVECVKYFNDWRLNLAAHYHDCGKYYTKRFFNAKGEPTETAHYYGHDNYSAYLTLCDLLFNYSKENDIDIADLKYIVQLVNWHMMPFLAWKESSECLKRDVSLIGKELYKDILILHQADIAAH